MYFMARPLAAAAGAQYYPDFKSLFDGQFLYVVEVGFERDPDGPNAATVRLTASHLDVRDGDGPTKGPGDSLMVSAMKRFAGRWALAGRWSKSYRRLSSDYRELLSLGTVWLTPLGRQYDFVAFGIFSGDPSTASRGRESGVEVMYKLQMSQAMSLSPDLQYWNRDDGGLEVRTWVPGCASTSNSESGRSETP